ncbi:hypothetical protein BBJ28_00016028 [Nothophytophthora sp. Chile5]|nr:hypothetical protein BBJ28_00016028 [Nothophytophthora sp. Chile5]
MPEIQPSEPDSKAPEDDELLLIAATNALLSRLGFGDRAFVGLADLVASVSSMSVALYEKLFQFRLRDVERTPRTRQDYEHNAQIVADALQGALLEQNVEDRATAAELTGERLCAGDLGSIRRLLQMLEQVYALLFEESQEIGDRLRDTSLASVGMAMAASEAVKDTSRRRIPPKFAKKQRGKQRRPGSEAEEGSDERERRSARASRRSTLQPRANKKQEEVRGGRLTMSEPRVRKAVVTGTRERRESSVWRAEELAEKTKKRSRLLERSVRSSGSSARAVNESQSRSRAARSSPKSSPTKQKEAMGEERDLLETKKYGRFVAPAGDDSEDEKPLEPHAGDPVVESKPDDRDPFFGGVSSVEHSNSSMHFMEEDGAFAHNFSSISIEDPAPEEPAIAASDSEADARLDTEQEPTKAAKAAHQRNKNQQEAEEEDETTASPVKKKVARDEPRAPERPSSSRVIKNKALYPLLPASKRNAASSKAQAQYLRYKLSLKDHLQELKQRETTQRQHLERAYKSGEHSANVDKIRSRRFEQDIRLRRIAIGLEAKNEEEKHLRHAMHHLLDLEKEKLREEHRLTTSVLQQLQKEHAEREAAMESFYASQIQLVKEQTHRETKERQLVEKAQRAASEQMMREMRRDRENQLAALLEQKQHLAETRRFRQASQMAQLLQKTDERSATRTDAFYTAAMKARERQTRTKKPAMSQQRSRIYTQRVSAKPTQRAQRSARLPTSTLRQ